MNDNLNIYTKDEQNQARIWNAYADRGYLQSTIDPRDLKGLKCDYIDTWSQYYIKKFLLTSNKNPDILEIGCGSGRNLFSLAPHIGMGYGIDIAREQIKNAESRKQHLKIHNVDFFDSPDVFFRLNVHIDSVFTMWVLAGFNNDENLQAMLALYCRNISTANRFVFFEQIACRSYTVTENRDFYKKVRTKSEYESIFTKAGFRICEFDILNEKGFGPLYRLVYMGRLYHYWPAWLNLNKFFFYIDRQFIRRQIAETFTDCVFICERIK
jgi:SAM-dependent methyltransferase